MMTNEKKIAKDATRLGKRVKRMMRRLAYLRELTRENDYLRGYYHYGPTRPTRWTSSICTPTGVYTYKLECWTKG